MASFHVEEHIENLEKEPYKWIFALTRYLTQFTDIRVKRIWY